MVFWIAIGLVAAGPPREPPPRAAAGRRLACAEGCGLGLVLGAVVFAFVSRFSFDRISPGQLLLSSLTLRERSGGASHLVEGVLLPTLLGGTLILTSAVGETVSRRRLAAAFTALWGALLAAGIAAAAATIAARLTPIPGADSTPAVAAAQARYLVCLSVGSLGVFALIGAAWAWCLSAGLSAEAAAARKPWALPFAASAAMAACLWFGCIEPAVADARAKWAQVLMAAKRLEPAMAALEGAISADPGAPPFRFMLCDCAELSDSIRPDPQALKRAAGMVPARRADAALDRSAYYRGRMLLLSAADATGGEQRDEALESARWFGRAQELEPEYPLVYADAALVERDYLGEPGRVASHLRTMAGFITAPFAPDWCDYFENRSSSAREPKIKRFYAQRAAECLARAASGTPGDGKLCPRYLRLSILWHSLGERPDAIAAADMAAALGNSPERWRAEALLAQYGVEGGDASAALKHLDASIGMAPAESRENLRQLRAAILQRAPHAESGP
jgi:tetratricopeptide (TPR) repeat protein